MISGFVYTIKGMYIVQLHLKHLIHWVNPDPILQRYIHVATLVNHQPLPCWSDIQCACPLLLPTRSSGRLCWPGRGDSSPWHRVLALTDQRLPPHRPEPHQSRSHQGGRGGQLQQEDHVTVSLLHGDFMYFIQKPYELIRKYFIQKPYESILKCTASLVFYTETAYKAIFKLSLT